MTAGSKGAKRLAIAGAALAASYAIYRVAVRDARRPPEATVPDLVAVQPSDAAPTVVEMPAPPVPAAPPDAESRWAKQVAIFRAMTPAERLAEMVRSCPPEGPCDTERLVMITQAAGDDAERALLSVKAEALVAAYQREAADAGQAARPEGGAPSRQAEVDENVRHARNREAFTKLFELELVQRQLNPERVSATGPDKTTLDVRGFACSGEFLSNVRKSTLATEARGLGFKRLTCSNGQTNAGIDL